MRHRMPNSTIWKPANPGCRSDTAGMHCRVCQGAAESPVPWNRDARIPPVAGVRATLRSIRQYWFRNRDYCAVPSGRYRQIPAAHRRLSGQTATGLFHSCVKPGRPLPYGLRRLAPGLRLVGTNSAFLALRMRLPVNAAWFVRRSSSRPSHYKRSQTPPQCFRIRVLQRVPMAVRIALCGHTMSNRRSGCSHASRDRRQRYADRLACRFVSLLVYLCYSQPECRREGGKVMRKVSQEYSL